MPEQARPDRGVILDVEWVLFDLDGTLVDHRTAQTAAISGWIRADGLPEHVDGVPSAQVWHDVAEEAFVDYRTGRLTFEAQRRQRVSRFLPLVGVDITGMDDESLDAEFDKYLHRYEAAWQAYPDVEQALTRLCESVRIAVLTNGDQSQQEAKVRRTGLVGLVERVIASSSLGVAKPDPRAFTGAVALVGASASTTAYVGDRLDIDARAARAAGLVGVWLDRGADEHPDVDVPVVRSLADLHAAPRR